MDSLPYSNLGVWFWPIVQSGAARASDLAPKSNVEDFFFPRSSLDGGFYLTEGQTVTFEARPSPQTNELAGKSNTESPAGVEDTDGSHKSLPVARHIRLCDLATGEEQPVTPVMLHGCVQNWDPISGSGVIAELDLAGSLHSDAPRFSFDLEDLDMVNINDLHQGCFVRFCIEYGDRGAARRVILDRPAGNKHQSPPPWRSSQGVSRGTGFSTGSKFATGRYYGTVRELVEERFGFIVMEETGESIFFHMNNVDKHGNDGAIRVGDAVSFLLRDVAQGKHAGKRACLKIRKCSSPASATSLGHYGDEENDEFDLLE